ncbi:MAG: hypothetical protein CML20_19115 [Rheinheimera sp.]|uniref:DUF2069 domain-containing protein n=1 Tax=Arsukibacterium sp. UBA3155 TaxID=1946058 RepID=UPI000C98F696|nr:DUF2069 domain-containing protein [Arsukibacterium sp. UBA3155]MAD76864.1 hypothetical protein [Rheinheimera sp.]|tara:strand:+ start:48859 stop:49299 length:441 start_codon:yes stop_codon:yes gene_type:complete
MNEHTEVAMAPRTKIYLLLARFGYWGLWLLIPLWLLWLAPATYGSTSQITGNKLISTALLWLPLWLPMYGIIKGKAYTFAWANFIVMIYFLHSLTNLWVSTGLYQMLAFIELLLASIMFIGCTYFARHRGIELGLKIPRLKDDPRQ